MSTIGSQTGLQQVLALRQQIAERSDALQTLRNAAPQTAAPTSPSDKTAGVDFAETLSDAVQEVNATQKRASDMAAAYERGEVTDVAQVMLARQESSVAFEATLQVRNKLLTAYQDIMRMGV
ncbi:flagellar hook-basal body complex protein FliE [Erythrobacter sp. HA6-11]